jgi:hypothetical protein
MAGSMIERIATVLMEMNQEHDVTHYTDSAYYIFREIGTRPRPWNRWTMSVSGRG